jgi:hypothetical protein
LNLERFSWKRLSPKARLALPLALLLAPLGWGGWRLAGPSESSQEFQIKGAAELLVYARKEHHTELLDRFNRIVHPGDEVRFILTGVPDDHSHVLIVSVDGAGVATIYFPYGGTRSAPVVGPGRWEVPGSIVLDGTLGPERVFAIFSKQALVVAELEPALRSLGRAGNNALRDVQALDVPGVTQRSFLMFKRERPAGSAPVTATR